MSMDVSLKPSTSVRDITLTLNGSPQQLVGSNLYRTHLQFQAPAGGAVTYSYTNASCAAGLTGCYTLAAGSTWAPSWGCPSGPIYVNGTNAQVLVATEC